MEFTVENLVENVHVALNGFEEAQSQHIKALNELEGLKADLAILEMKADAELGNISSQLKNDTERKGFKAQWLLGEGWDEIKEAISVLGVAVERTKAEVSVARRRYDVAMMMLHITEGEGEV